MYYKKKLYQVCSHTNQNHHLEFQEEYELLKVTKRFLIYFSNVNFASTCKYFINAVNFLTEEQTNNLNSKFFAPSKFPANKKWKCERKH